MSEWQPIETAPKDGTRILVPYPLRSGYEVLIVKWNGCGWDSDSFWMLHEEPARWMPLPPPPGACEQ